MSNIYQSLRDSNRDVEHMTRDSLEREIIKLRTNNPAATLRSVLRQLRDDREAWLESAKLALECECCGEGEAIRMTVCADALSPIIREISEALGEDE